MKNLKEYIILTVGVIFVAAATEFFMVPNRLAAGGVMGIAILLNDVFPMLSIGTLMLMMNIVLFIIAFIVIGNKFGGKTIYCSISLSGMIWLFEKTPLRGVSATSNLFLASVFGTLISGIGMAIVFNENASTGGTDILAKILNKFIHVNIGKALLAVDFIVTLFCGAAFGAEIGMYALLCVIMNGFVIDKVIEGLSVSKQILVISSKNHIIGKYIMEDMDRGCTIFHGKGGFSGKDTYILFTVLGRREFIKLKKYIMQVDNRAFISISDAHEVLGEGFKDIIEED
jgi:uncharacterized membrane-anchored protein YitT (DUF2179 family)